MMRVSMVIPALALAAGAAVAQHAPPAAANCARAASGTERLICGDARLVEGDANLTAVYRRLLAHSEAPAQNTIRAEQRAWLTKRNACRDATCLREQYDARTTALYAQLGARDRLLRRGLSQVGQCAVTRIDQIGPRLGDANDTASRPDDTGTSVSFANGVHQVSYDLERPVARSRIGDAARVCLVSIPRNCPRGDDRGRQYAVTNLRTGERWKLYDSQHMCGGA
jgi:uncharacterized protein YecT (DUF1311 family)